MTHKVQISSWITPPGMISVCSLGNFSIFNFANLPLLLLMDCPWLNRLLNHYSPCPASLLMKRKISVERKEEWREEGKGEKKRNEEREMVASRKGETDATGL